MEMTLAQIAICSTLLPFFACAQATHGSCERAFEMQFPPGGKIRMHVRSGDIGVIGVHADAIRITCKLERHPDRVRDVEIAFKRVENSGDLRVSGGPNGDFRIRIEVPRQSHLWIRAPAGDLKVEGVVGDKDVEIHAGDLVIEVGEPSDYAYAEGSIKAGDLNEPSDYAYAEGSIKAGDLNAPAFGVNKGGLFRSFKKESASGKYRLHAHVGAGDLVLK